MYSCAIKDPDSYFVYSLLFSASNLICKYKEYLTKVENIMNINVHRVMMHTCMYILIKIFKFLILK